MLFLPVSLWAEFVFLSCILLIYLYHTHNVYIYLSAMPWCLYEKSSFEQTRYKNNCVNVLCSILSHPSCKVHAMFQMYVCMTLCFSTR